MKGRYMKKLLNFLKKGSSEALAFAYVAPLICFLIIEACAYVNLNSNVHELLLALDSAGRGACICTNFDDAEDMAQMIAESSIHSTDISNIQVSIDYATADTDWQAGLLLRVTITADINSLSILFNPSFSTMQGYRTVSKTMIYTVEGANFDSNDLITVAAVIQHEDGSSHSGMIACATALVNRKESTAYPDTWNEILIPSQFEDLSGIYSLISNPNNISGEAYDCARIVLSGGKDSRLMNPPNSVTHNQGPCCSWNGNKLSTDTEDSWYCRKFVNGKPITTSNQSEMCIVIGNQYYHWQW